MTIWILIRRLEIYDYTPNIYTKIIIMSMAPAERHPRAEIAHHGNVARFENMFIFKITDPPTDNIYKLYDLQCQGHL